MKTAWVLLILTLAQVAQAASTSRTVTVSCRRGGAVPVDDRVYTRRPVLQKPSVVFPEPHPYCSHPFTFRMDVTPEGPISGERTSADGQPLMLVRPGVSYTVRLYNPLPVRAGVTLSVDGLNTLTGRPGGAVSGAKWMVQPHGSISISGWQTGRENARRFVFTAKRESYASYRSEQTGQDLTVNSGVIGAAFFWNAAELEGALEHHWDPPVAYDGHGIVRRAKAMPGAASSLAPMEDARGFDAGTGMGESLAHPVRSVAFDFTAGMYNPAEALAIYYDFAGPGDNRPRPFEDAGGSFAPEMPNYREGRDYRAR